MKTIQAKFVPGERVRCGDVRGHVSCVSVTWPSKVRYEMTWWDSGQHRDAWFDEFELESEETKA